MVCYYESQHKTVKNKNKKTSYTRIIYLQLPPLNLAKHKMYKNKYISLLRVIKKNYFSDHLYKSVNNREQGKQ